MNGGKFKKKGKNEIKLFTIKEEFLNEERLNIRESAKRDFSKRLDRNL